MLTLVELAKRLRTTRNVLRMAKHMLRTATMRAVFVWLFVAVSARPSAPHRTPAWLRHALLKRGGADAPAEAATAPLDGVASSAPLKMHEPLSIKEIAALLDRVPVFGVTDLSGSSVVVNAAMRDPSGGTAKDAAAAGAGEPSLFFFMHADLAKAMLAQLEAAAAAAGDGAANKPPPMKVSAFSLGRTYCRFALGASGDELGVAEPAMNLPDNVRVRFVADPRDVQGAQVLAASLGAAPAANASEADANATAAAAAEAAVARFNETVVPLFTIAQINVQKGEERMRPWFFSMGHLMQLWRNSTQNSTDADVYKQGEVHLSSLRELCDAMREPSPVDYRKFLFVAYEGASEAVASTSGEAGAKPAGSADQVGDAVAAAVEKMQAAAGLDDSKEGGLFD